MKSLIIAPLLVFGVLIGATPIASAQIYGYPYNYGTSGYSSSSYGATPQICTALTTYQTLGSTDLGTSGQVTMLQVFLNRAGYLSGVTGTYDYGTVGAVVNYQRAHNLVITGTVGPLTRSIINQESCGAGYQNNYTNPYAGNSNTSNCTWNGSTYVCSYGVPVAPVAPIYTPVYNGGYNNNYNNGYGNCGNSYGYYSNTCGPQYGVVLNSSTASYNYNTTTLTVRGSGFTPNGNTVYFGTTVIPNVASYDGSTITFSVPTGYYPGTYNISVKNSLGYTSNSLQFIISAANGYQNGYYNNNNNYYYAAPTLSSISGPSIVSTNTANIWTVTSTGTNNNQPVTLRADWGDGISSVNDTQQGYGQYGSNTYSFNHMYSTPGTYTLRITATSNSGQTSYATYIITARGW